MQLQFLLEVLQRVGRSKQTEMQRTLPLLLPSFAACGCDINFMEDAKQKEIQKAALMCLELACFFFLSRSQISPWMCSSEMY